VVIGGKIEAAADDVSGGCLRSRVVDGLEAVTPGAVKDVLEDPRGWCWICDFFPVMAGLVPAIHVFCDDTDKDVDA